MFSRNVRVYSPSPTHSTCIRVSSALYWLCLLCLCRVLTRPSSARLLRSSPREERGWGGTSSPPPQPSTRYPQKKSDFGVFCSFLLFWSYSGCGKFPTTEIRTPFGLTTQELFSETEAAVRVGMKRLQKRACHEFFYRRPHLVYPPADRTRRTCSTYRATWSSRAPTATRSTVSLYK